MVTMSKNRIRSMDMPIIEKVFDMESGYVLNFVNRNFAEFFQEELGVNIYDPRWAVLGNSKAKRLRCYLRHADRKTALETLERLWEYREASSITASYQKLEDTVRSSFFRIIERLGGKPPAEVSPVAPQPAQRIDEAVASKLASRLLKVSKMDPQPRGYTFEKFLKDLFDEYGLPARGPFRLKGEQIDGSFVLDDDTYLLEAKWTNDQVGAATLHAFNAKVEDKARWSRGLFISQSGFSVEGLTAFGRGKSAICMDGLDLYDVLSQRLDLACVLALKVRRVAETGEAFIRVRDLDLPLTV